MQKLRVATIGAGFFSQFHHDAWSRIEEVELVAVCDSDDAKAREFAQRWNVPKIYRDVSVMLDAEKPDLIDIITPPQTHLGIIAEATRRKIDAVCQKAFCQNLKEAERAVEIAENAGIRLVVHENFRFQPWYREMHRQLQAGRIGDPYQISFRLRPGDGQGSEAYLARQPYFQKMQRFLVHETGIHFIDTFRFLFGEVQSVYASLSRLNPIIAGEDAGFILFDFDGGKRGLFDGNRLVDHVAANPRLTMGEMQIEGSRGILRLDGSGQVLFRALGSPAETEIPFAWESRGAGGDSVHALQKHVVDHLLRDRPLANPARDYLMNLRIEEAVYASAAEGRRVEL